MRRFYAWLLLVVSTAQWIGGHICFEVQYFMEVPQEMSVAEQTISKDIFEETGVETTVTVVPDHHRVRWGADYANYFTFSKTDSTGAVYFTIDYAPRTTILADFADPAPTKSQGDSTPKNSVLKQLFAEFLFPSAELPTCGVADLTVTNFQLTQLGEQLRPSPLSPPPDQLCC